MRPALMLGSVVFVAALFMAVSSFGFTDVVSKTLIAVAVGMLFIVAAALMSGILRVEVLVTEEQHEEPGLNRRRNLNRLASRYGLNGTGNPEEVKQRLFNHLWREKTGGERAEPLEPQSAQLLVEHLATPRPSLEPGNLKTFNRGTLKLLVQEGKSLLALARLFDIEKEAYGRMITRARRAMRNGDIERSIQAMQVANDSLRARLEDRVTREW